MWEMVMVFMLPERGVDPDRWRRRTYVEIHESYESCEAEWLRWTHDAHRAPKGWDQRWRPSIDEHWRKVCRPAGPPVS